MNQYGRKMMVIHGMMVKVLVLYIVGVQYHFHALIAGLGDILPDRQRRTPSGQSAGDGQYTLE